MIQLILVGKARNQSILMFVSFRPIRNQPKEFPLKGNSLA